MTGKKNFLGLVSILALIAVAGTAQAEPYLAAQMGLKWTFR